MLVPATLFVASLFGLSLGKPVVFRRMQVHEARQSVPSGFTSNGPASPDTTLQLRLNLKSNNMEGLINSLLDVSTPSSANYGNHLSKADVCHGAQCMVMKCSFQLCLGREVCCSLDRDHQRCHRMAQEQQHCLQQLVSCRRLAQHHRSGQPGELFVGCRFLLVYKPADRDDVCPNPDILHPFVACWPT